MSRILIANMPFYSLRWPNLGPSLLKAALGREGVECDVAYFNFDFAERLGLEHYHWLADQFAFVLGGERLFARHFFGDAIPDDEAFYRDVLLPADPELGPSDRADYERTFRHVGPFLDECAAAVDWSRYAAVGFSASFQQTMPSLCLARRIKRLCPRVRILFGGAACEAEMGVELLRQFPEIDYAFLGEADLTFPAVVKQIVAGGPAEVPPGVAERGTQDENRERFAGFQVYDGLPRPSRGPEIDGLGRPSYKIVADLDALPYPDFDDYFDRLRRSPLAGDIEPLVFFETARGCWWGQKRHCAFCGLNGGTLAFRRKGPARAVDELRHLVGRYGVRRACAADNILHPRALDDFLPLVRASGLDLRFEYEMRTDLTRSQVDALVAAGLGAAQLGIETFSTPVLKRIGKGTTAIENLQTLKWFSAAGVEVKWNLLYGIPGEDPANYAAMAELLPALVHLAPPLAVGRVRMDRFSPYFDDPAAFGMVDARPHRAFRHVYPFDDDVLRRLAYYFEYDYADGRNPLDYAGPTIAAARTWQRLAGSVTLRAFDREDGALVLTDTRPCAAAFQRRLLGVAREVYRFCDTARSLPEIVAFLAAAGGKDSASEAAVRSLLDEWIRSRLMVRLDDRYLSLALPAPSNLELAPG